MEAANLLLYLLVLHSITKPIPLCTVLQLAQRILHNIAQFYFHLPSISQTRVRGRSTSHEQKHNVTSLTETHFLK